ncbi:MAG: LysM peptidoglycan-binding domain-containing protein [bacterium]|nr:LysM peptidoglycan-binding domain-containing protein [bacterium]
MRQKITGLLFVFIFSVLVFSGTALCYKKNPDGIKIQKGDTLWQIAEKEMGNPLLWKKIAKLNGIRDPEKLRIGKVLKLPCESGKPNDKPTDDKKIKAPSEKKREEKTEPQTEISAEGEHIQIEDEKPEDLEPVATEPQTEKEEKTETEQPCGLKDLGIHGFVKNETAYRINHPEEFAKIKNILFVGKEGKFADNIGYKATARLYYDAVFDFTDNFAKGVEKNQEREAELRDGFLDFSLGNFDLRVGKQQIVWGETVGGLFFADVVNPKDLREFILPEPDQMRVPVWAADLEYFYKGNHFELVWLPFPKFHELGVLGSEFELKGPPMPQGIPVYSENLEKPAKKIKNQEVGFRMSRFLEKLGLDISAFGFYGYDYFPTVFRALNIDPATSTPVITLKPQYERLPIFGATFSKDLNDIILKGELVYNKGKYFSVDDSTDSDGAVKKDFIDYIIGVDYTFFGKIDFNFQFMQRIVFNHDDKMIDGKTNTSASVWLKTGFLDNKLEPELLFVFGLDKNDYLLRPKINYKINGCWQVAAGADIFGGEPNGNFGQFDNKDRTYVELKYIF